MSRAGKIVGIVASVILGVGALGFATNVYAEQTPPKVQSKAILFITGAFVSHHCWDEWRAYFQEKGYVTVAPPWPHKDADAAVLRGRQPDAQIASIRLAELTDYYAQIAAMMPEKPILIGHSLGGLLVQLLLQRDLGVAGVAIDSLGPRGVVTLKYSFFKSTWKPLGYFSSSSKSFLMNFEQWQYAFTNGLPPEVQKTSYEKLVIPESKIVLRDALTAAAAVDFDKPRAPLLLIAGGADHIIPAALNRTNFKKYADNRSVTDYKEFPGRTHFTLGQDGWQDVAEYILAWLN